MVTRTQRLQRTALLLGDERLEKLKNSHVMLLGLGGVGSYAAEALARAGVGRLTIVDSDVVAPSNLNRQLPALSSAIGQKKTEVVRARLMDAAPDLRVDAVDAFYLPQSPIEIPQDCNMVLDAIDTVSAKLDLAVRCKERGIPLIACMGMGNRLDPTQIRIGDLFQTSGCPLCRVMRRELRKRGVESLRCVYSLEPAITPAREERLPDGDGCGELLQEPSPKGRPAPGSVSFVPSVAGLYMAYAAVTELISPTHG